MNEKEGGLSNLFADSRLLGDASRNGLSTENDRLYIFDDCDILEALKSLKISNFYNSLDLQ